MKLQEFDGGDVDGTKPGRARDEQGIISKSHKLFWPVCASLLCFTRFCRTGSFGKFGFLENICPNSKELTKLHQTESSKKTHEIDSSCKLRNSGNRKLEECATRHRSAHW